MKSGFEGLEKGFCVSWSNRDVCRCWSLFLDLFSGKGVKGGGVCEKFSRVVGLRGKYGRLYRILACHRARI